jgi:hypothetical protein
LYEDGCDVLALMQSKPPVSGGGPALGHMDSLETGAWVVMAGEIERSRVIGVGRLTFDEVRTFLQSSLIGD